MKSVTSAQSISWRGGGFRLLNEALLAEFVFPLLCAEDPDADESVETEVARLVDHTLAFDQFTIAVANSPSIHLTG
jgi:hypothetical protein